jgi:hypothetical protein
MLPVAVVQRPTLCGNVISPNTIVAFEMPHIKMCKPDCLDYSSMQGIATEGHGSFL